MTMSVTKRAPAVLLRGPAIMFKRAEISEAGSFSGYASVFGVVDHGHDVVLAGAYKASLAARSAGDVAPVRMLFNHDQGEPIGVWDAIEEDDVGLKVSGRLILDVQRAREIHALMLAGALDGLSIGYAARDHERDHARGVRLLKQIDLWEVSVVTFPMCAPSRIGDVKSGREAASAAAIIAALDRRRRILGDGAIR